MDRAVLWKLDDEGICFKARKCATSMTALYYFAAKPRHMIFALALCCNVVLCPGPSAHLDKILQVASNASLDAVSSHFEISASPCESGA